MFKISTGYKLELLSEETMRSLGSTKRVIDKDKNSENVPKLESIEVVFMHCNVAENDYQQASKSVIYIIVWKGVLSPPFFKSSPPSPHPFLCK